MIHDDIGDPLHPRHDPLSTWEWSSDSLLALGSSGEHSATLETVIPDEDPCGIGNRYARIHNQNIYAH